MKADPTKLAKGTEVTCEIVWKDGRRTHGRGKLLFVDGDKAYVETSLGAVEVDLETVEEA